MSQKFIYIKYIFGDIKMFCVNKIIFVSTSLSESSANSVAFLLSAHRGDRVLARKPCRAGQITGVRKKDEFVFFNPHELLHFRPIHSI